MEKISPLEEWLNKNKCKRLGINTYYRGSKSLKGKKFVMPYLPMERIKNGIC
jgi:hypothetical protein